MPFVISGAELMAALSSVIILGLLPCLWSAHGGKVVRLNNMARVFGDRHGVGNPSVEVFEVPSKGHYVIPMTLGPETVIRIDIAGLESKLSFLMGEFPNG